MLSDYPRGVANCLQLCWFPGFDALAVAPALAVAFLLATRCRSVLLLRFPSRPFPRSLPAPCAAIALARVPRMKTLLASLEHTVPYSWPPHAALPPASRLIFARVCKTLGRAHGR